MNSPESIQAVETYRSFFQQATAIFDTDPFTKVTQGVRIPIPPEAIVTPHIRVPQITIARKKWRYTSGQPASHTHALLSYETVKDEYSEKRYVWDMKVPPASESDIMIRNILCDYTDSAEDAPIAGIVDDILTECAGNPLSYRIEELIQPSLKKGYVLLSRKVDNAGVGERSGIRLEKEYENHPKCTWEIWPWRISTGQKLNDTLQDPSVLHEIFNEMQEVAQLRAKKYK